MNYFVTIIIKRHTFHFTIALKSDSFYWDDAVENALRKAGALENDDEVMSISFRSKDTIVSLDNLVAKYQ